MFFMIIENYTENKQCERTKISLYENYTENKQCERTKISLYEKPSSFFHLFQG